MKTSHLAGVFLLSFVAFAIAWAPLGLVAQLLAGKDIGYSRAEGTVWNGTLHNVAVGQASLGDLDVKTSPLSVLALSPRLDWRLSGGPVNGHGEMEIGWLSGTYALRNAVVDAELERLPLVVRLNGTLAATITDLAWGADGCRTAEGQLRTDTLERRPGGLDWQGPRLAGDIRCMGDRLRISARGRNESGLLSLRADIEPALDYRLTATARMKDERLGRSLPLLGFTRKEENDYQLVLKGRLGSGKQEPRRK